jgi:hypothetical protein
VVVPKPDIVAADLAGVANVLLAEGMASGKLPA